MAQAYRREKLVKIMDHFLFEKDYAQEKAMNLSASETPLSEEEKTLMTYFNGQVDMVDRLYKYMLKELDL